MLNIQFLHCFGRWQIGGWFSTTGIALANSKVRTRSANNTTAANASNASHAARAIATTNTATNTSAITTSLCSTTIQNANHRLLLTNAAIGVFRCAFDSVVFGCGEFEFFVLIFLALHISLHITLPWICCCAWCASSSVLYLIKNTSGLAGTVGAGVAMSLTSSDESFLDNT